MNRLQTTLKNTEEDVHSLRDTVAQQKDELHASETEHQRLHNTIEDLKVSQQLEQQINTSQCWRSVNFVTTDPCEAFDLNPTCNFTV